MAISKLMHMKECKGFFPRHLKNAIVYIMKPEKMDGQHLVNVNQAMKISEINVEKVFATMINTKKKFGKEWGRQGYHFVVSFSENDTVSPEDALKIMDEIQKEYLHDDYECVYAVHTNTEHLHGHLIFNSIDRFEGKKYHYKKGDWEKDILPCVNRVCRRWGLTELKLEKKKEKIKKYSNKKDNFLREELDDVIKSVRNYDEFIQELLRRDYEVKEGRYLSICMKNMDKKKFRRTSSLGSEYTKEKIKERIEAGTLKKKKIKPELKENKKYDATFTENRRDRGFIQKEIFYYILCGEKYKRNRRLAPYRNFYFEQKKYILQATYLKYRNYTSVGQVKNRNKELWKLESKAKQLRNKIYNDKRKEEFKLYVEIAGYMNLSPMEQTMGVKKEISDRMKKLNHLGWDFESIQKEWKKMDGVLKEINDVLAKVRREKKITYDIMKQSEERQKEKLKEILQEEKKQREQKAKKEDIVNEKSKI